MNKLIYFISIILLKLTYILSWETCSNFVDNKSFPICKFGLKCFKKDESYAECRSQCPTGWLCETVQKPMTTFGLCGAFYGHCDYPMRCFKKNSFFYACNTHCPKDWKCNDEFRKWSQQLSTTTPMPICGNSYGKCPDGLECFEKTTDFFMCHNFCPNTWECSRKSKRSSELVICTFYGSTVFYKIADSFVTLNTSIIYKNCTSELFNSKEPNLKGFNNRFDGKSLFLRTNNSFLNKLSRK